MTRDLLPYMRMMAIVSAGMMMHPGLCGVVGGAMPFVGAPTEKVSPRSTGSDVGL